MKTYKGRYKRIEVHETDVYINAKNEIEAKDILQDAILDGLISKEDEIFIDKRAYTSCTNEEWIHDIVEVDDIPESSVAQIKTLEDLDILYDGTLKW